MNPKSSGISTQPADCLDAPAWFALQVLPRHELCVELLLSAKGIEHYVPRTTRRATRKRSDRTNPRQVNLQGPLFPGYVLARFAWTLRHHALNTVGVTRMVEFVPGEPAPLSDTEVAQLHVLEQEQATPAELTIGTRVRILDGKLAGFVGVLQHDGDVVRLIVSVPMFGRACSVPVTIERDSIEVAA